jgi:amino acid transporter
MTRWVFFSLAVILIIGGLTILGARLLGRTSRASVLVSVIAHWLGAFVLWSFAGGLALHYGILSAYPGPFFGLVALAGGFWHYRTIVSFGRDRGLTVFVGVQLAWLVIVLAQNGVFKS